MELPLIFISLFSAVAFIFAVLALITTFWRAGGADFLPVEFLWFMTVLFFCAAAAVCLGAFIFYPALKELLL